MQITNEEMLSWVNLNNELKSITEKFDVIKDKYLQKENNDFKVLQWRNTKMEYWIDICSKYNEDDLLNCYGDIFYIIDSKGEKGERVFTGKRVLWNLGLSKEDYLIKEYIERDSDDEYEYTCYEVEVKNNG